MMILAKKHLKEMTEKITLKGSTMLKQTVLFDWNKNPTSEHTFKMSEMLLLQKYSVLFYLFPYLFIFIEPP